MAEPVNEIPAARSMVLHESIFGLQDRNPLASASFTLTQKHRYSLLGMVVVFVALAILFPFEVAVWTIGILMFIYVASLLDRLHLFIRGIDSDVMVRISDAEALAIADEDLPVYTVLLPAFDEPNLVADLMRGVGRLDYPADRLDLKLLLEADDHATVDAAVASNETEVFEIVLVPAAEPRTKPKACNYGLFDALGKYVTIYDAEDIPDPLQLRRVVAAFDRLPDDVACMQAKLVYHNDQQNLLTRWFTSEYDQWFGYILPGLMGRKGPIPLGGTSNHIKRSILQEVGGWDSFNVTEDADLGFRLARGGYRTAVLDSVTYEEANSDPINWVRQRSRWYKGYLQTFIVHFREPVRTVRELGFLGFLRFMNLSAGTPVLTVINMLFWLMTLIWLTGAPPVFQRLFPPLSYFMALFCLTIGNAVVIYMGIMAARLDRKPHLAWPALLVPGYWIMMSVAATKAIIQIVFQPSYWEKTFHGLDTGSGPRPSGD